MALDRVPLSEIEKWLVKLQKELEKTDAKTGKGKEMLKNIMAYRDDCRHWLEKKNYVLAFESVIWAWALLETAVELKQLSDNVDKEKGPAKQKS